MQTATAIAAGTLLPTANPTTVAQTATAQQFNLLATPTPFTASNECPSDPFSPTDLDPEWVAACIHCLPATPTRTPGGFSDWGDIPQISFGVTVTYPTLDFSTATPEMVGTATLTPTNTATSTRTPTPMGTPSWDVAQITFDGTDTMDWTEYRQFGGDAYSLVSGHTGLAYQSGSGVFYGNAFQNTIVLWLNTTNFAVIHTVEFWARVTSNQSDGGTQSFLLAGTYGGAGGYQDSTDYGYPTTEWQHYSVQYNGGLTQSDALAIYFYRASGDGSTQIQLDDIRVYFSGYVSTPTPTPTATLTTPTATFTPTPTGTWYTPTPDWTATATPDRSFRPGADCRTPVYVVQKPIVDVDLGQNDSACYRLFPEIHLNNDVIVAVHIDVPPLDFCFDFYELTVNFIGLDIDIAFFVSVGIALLLVRFGLFSG